MKKALIAVLAISIVSLAVFYYLGGFNEIKKSALPSGNNTTIFGIGFQGKAGSDTLRNYFNKAKRLVTEGKGNAIAIAYLQDVDDRGFVNNFIGIKTTRTNLKDSSWSYREFKSPASVTACIKSHPIVLPSPENLLEELNEYALNQNMKPDSLFIEYYTGPQEVCVELFCKP